MFHLGSGLPFAEHINSKDSPATNITDLLASCVITGGITVIQKLQNINFNVSYRRSIYLQKVQVSLKLFVRSDRSDRFVGFAIKS